MCWPAIALVQSRFFFPSGSVSLTQDSCGSCQSIAAELRIYIVKNLMVPERVEIDIC